MHCTRHDQIKRSFLYVGDGERILDRIVSVEVIRVSPPCKRCDAWMGSVIAGLIYGSITGGL